MLLYELLTGSTPLDATAAEARRRWRDPADDPRGGAAEAEHAAERPATALPSIAANRQHGAGEADRLVRGELDWIVMKALEKDRNRRYETANGFAADVRAVPGRRAGAGVSAVGRLSAAEVRAAEPGAGGRGGLVLLALVGRRGRHDAAG